MTTHQVPPGLGEAGAALWRDVVAVWQLRPDELRLLEHACRTVDDEARLSAALAEAPTLTKGSMGQERVSPLFGEVRAARALVAKLLQQLGLPDEDERAAGKAGQRQAQAQAAAAARWRRSLGA